VHHRVCVECGEEFRPEIERCSDCGGDLRDVTLDASGREVVPEAEDAPPPDAGEAILLRPIFVGAQASLLVPLADRLQEQQVPFRLAEETDEERGTARYSLLVAEADRENALRAVADLLDGETDPGLLHAIETRFESEGGYLRCPACDTELPPGTIECPECGLAVATGPDA
jgi:rRNA maturation endonuclease Nob1